MKSFSPRLALSSLLVALQPFGFVLPQVTTNCPILGPAFPASSTLRASDAVQSATVAFPRILQAALANILPDNVTTSFSINVFSGFENQSIFNFHYAAPGLNGSLPSGELNNDTIYRIGSLSKLLTVYTFLDQVGFTSLQDPITKWIPELAASPVSNEVDNIGWQDIKIEALMSHLAGIPRDYALLDLSTENLPFATYGLPELNVSQIPQCGLDIGLPLCSRDELVKGISGLHPVTTPFNTAIYTNAGFVLLAFVLESMTGKGFDELFNASLVQGLRLSGTSLQTPNNSNAIIPVDPLTSFWSIPSGTEGPAGGMYSSTNDITAIGQSILRSTLLSATDTLKWLKPKAHTSDIRTSVGSPWEIIRMDVPLSSETNVTRVVDMYTKEGDVGLYSSFLALDPDHHAGFGILAAGAATTAMVDGLAGLIAATFVPAFEQAAREAAAVNFAGTYVEPGTNSSSRLTLTTDNSRPGLGISDWISQGVDMLSVLKTFSGIKQADVSESIRLYPVHLSAGNKAGFRAVFEPLPKPTSSSPFSATCQTWTQIDSLAYGLVGLDDFVIETDQRTGKAIAVLARGFRQRLVRT